MTQALNMTPFGGCFTHYQSAVRDELVRQGAYAGPEWFATQLRRVAIAFDLGESAELCGASLAMFSRGARKAKTPLQLAVRVVKF